MFLGDSVKRSKHILNPSFIIAVTAASNESDNVGKSFFQLKLCMEENSKINNIFIEMTISEFYKFLHDLEKANNNLDLLL
nr:PREDICTED: COMM domain-containing protein 7-like isoform X1 [Megachile rotundata]